jgi:hypothetical protein
LNLCAAGLEKSRPMRGRATARSTQSNDDFSGISSGKKVLDGIGDLIQPHEGRRIDQHLQLSLVK